MNAFRIKNPRFRAQKAAFYIKVYGFPHTGTQGTVRYGVITIPKEDNFIYLEAGSVATDCTLPCGKIWIWIWHNICSAHLQDFEKLL